MKLVKRLTIAALVLATAIIIVDCNRTLQEVLEEQVAKLSAEQADQTEPSNTSVVPSTRTGAEEQDCDQSGQPETASSESTCACSKAQSAAKKSQPQRPQETKGDARQAKDSKKRKYKVITITVPDDPEAETVVVTKSNEQIDADNKDTAEEKPVKNADEESSEISGEQTDEQKLSEEVAEKEAEKMVVEKKQHSDKNKTSKKTKGSGKSRDKRETKKSGSGKNGKAKRSAEKSKKYNNKNKSKRQA